MKRLLASLMSAGLLMGLTACTEGAKKEPLPDGVSLLSDQSRLHRKDREIFVRIKNKTRKTLHVESFTLTSARIKTVKWSGDENIDAGTEADLEYDMPKGAVAPDSHHRSNSRIASATAGCASQRPEQMTSTATSRWHSTAIVPRAR